MASMALVCLTMSWLAFQAAGKIRANEWLKAELVVGGEETTLVLAVVRDGYLYIVEESEDLRNWSERDRFYGEAGDSLVERPLGLFDEGFIRLRLVEILPVPEDFARIPAGAFLMGSPTNELGRSEDETQREVTLTNEFYLSKTEVTWSDWTAVRDWGLSHGYEGLAIGKNGREGDESGMHPVTEVSRSNAVKWCNARSERDGRTPVYYTSENFSSDNVLRSGSPTPFADWSADGYRLPTEAEWEYACRAETTTAFYTGGITHADSSPLDSNLDLAGWYGGNSENATHPVRSKLAKAFGLFDMHGNVREWCWDWYCPYEGNAVDPKGPETGEIRVFRGGSWGEGASECRAANRDGFSPTPATDNYGFRIALNSTP